MHIYFMIRITCAKIDVEFSRGMCEFLKVNITYTQMIITVIYELALCLF